MFEYEGQQYSLEEVQKAADESGLSIEDYVANAGLKPLDEGKQQGVVEGETTESPNQTPATDLSSAAGSSESQETDEFGNPIFDPSTLGTVPQEEEKYMGVSRKPILIPDDSDYQDMKRRTQEEFKGRKASRKLKNTPMGPILPYGDEVVIDDFNNETLNAVVTKDEKLQGMISQTLDNKQTDLQEGLSNIMAPFKDMEIEDISQEELEKAQREYSKLINQTIFADPDIQNRISKYQELIGDSHKADYDNYIVDNTIIDLVNKSPIGGAVRLGYQNMPTLVKGAYKTIHGIGTAVKAGGLGTADYLQVERQYQINQKLAEEQGWDDNTVGYFNNKGAFMVPKQDGFHPVASGYTKKGTWGEAQEQAKKIIEDGRENQKQDLELVFERQALESHFGHADVRDVLESGKSLQTLKTIASEQLPQMLSAILTFGTLPAAQMAGDNYLRQVQKQAKVKYNTLQPSIDQLMRVVEEDVNNEMFDSAMGVGFVSGAAEYVGASSVLGKSLGMSILKEGARQNAASLVKGQFKHWLKQQSKNGLTSVRGGFDEMMTEVFQQAASDVTVGEYIRENYIQGGGAGFIMGSLLPFSGNVTSSTITEVSNAYAVAAGKLDIKGLREFHQHNIARLNKDLQDGVITKETYEEKKQQLDNFMMSSQNFDRSMSSDQKSKLMDAEYKKNDAEKKLSDFQSSEDGKKVKDLESIRKQQIDVLNTQLKEGSITEEQHAAEIKNIDLNHNKSDLVRKSNTLKSQVVDANFELVSMEEFNANLNNTVKAFADLEIVGDNVVVAENTRQYAAEVLKDRGINNPTKEELDYVEGELKRKPGVFTSKGKIIVNAQGSVASGNVTTGSHEVLHAVLYNTFTALKDGKSKINTDALKQTVGALNNYLLELEDSGKIKDLDNWRSRMRSYQTYTLLGKKYSAQQLFEKADRNMEQFNKLASMSDVTFDPRNLEEFINVLSDSLLTGRVTYDQSFFEKIGDFIRRIMQDLGLKNIEFNTGKDVFNFIRDYNNSIVKGKSTKAQRQFAEYGGKGVLLQVDKNSKGWLAAEDMNSANEFEDKRRGPTKAQQEMSAEVQRLWDEQGVASVYDISEMYRPMFRKIVTRGNWDTLPGWNNYADIIEDEALTDVNGLMGIVMSYNPDKGVPLAAYINKYFALRAASIKNKYLGETFDTNVDDLAGGGPSVSDEQSIEEAIDKPASLGEFSRIRRKLGLEPQEMNKIRGVVTRTLSMSPDLMSTKKWKPSLFRSYLFEAYKGLIYKTILEKFPTRSAKFIEWASRNQGWIQEELSLNTLRKFPALNGVLYEFQKDAKGNVIRYTAEESRMLGIRDAYSGVNKVQRRYPTKEEWLNYLDPTRVGRSRNMPHEHKRVLAEAMSIDLGLDATLEVMQNPNQQFYDLEGNPVEGRVIDMYERMIEKNADIVEENQVIGRVAYLIERDPLMKFSANALDAGMGGLRMAELIMQNPDPLLKAFKDGIAPYKLMPNMMRDKQLGQLRIALTNNLVNTFAKEYPWLNEASAVVLSRQLALDFANIARNIDTVRLRTHKAVEAEFTDSLADNLFNIAQNTVLNEGHKSLLNVSENTISDEAKVNVLEKVFDNDVLSVLNESVSLDPLTLKNKLKDSFYKVKALYANGNLTREEVAFIFDTVFEAKNPIIGKASRFGVNMVLEKSTPKSLMYSIPTKYLSGYLANVVTNPRKDNSSIDILDDFVTIQVSKAYAKKLLAKQGVVMPHFRNNVEPTFLSRISRVPVGKQGSNNIEIYKENGEVVTIDHSALVSLDYNRSVGRNIQNLIDDLGKFSKDDMSNQEKKSLKDKEDEVKKFLENLKEEIEETGTINQDPEKIAKAEEEERLNRLAADLDAEFNSILEDVTGLNAKTEFSEVASKQLGRDKNKNVFFVPPSHDDYRGLIENYLVGKGDQSQKHISFFEEYLLEPYYEGVNNYSAERVRMIRQYRDIKKTFKPLFKQLKADAFPGMSVENAIRIYIWSRKGYDISGISENEIKQAQAFVVKDGMAREAAIEIMKITDLHGHVEPGKNWNSGGIIGDIIDSLKKNSRKKYLEEWNRNIDFIFNEKNKNKMRAAFGEDYIKSLDNIITRMKTGRNRLETGDSQFTNNIMNWLNGSVGVVMFANTRSAVLQLISFTNYIEAAGPNNVLKAGAAYANQKQFWSDVMTLVNSNYMRERREGLKIDINEAELVDATKNATNKFKAAVGWLLSKGFMPTQIADSLAIVMGGAPYYRNYVNEYLKQGLTQEEAEARAFIDFRNKTEESQQSSRPDRISAQQASLGGRLLLTFANTQSQYDRIIKKELSNLKNKRGSAAVSMSRIAYYGMAQHALFVSLQSALLGTLIGFSDDDEERLVKSDEFKLVNGMLDSFLRGAGIRGHIMSVIKNVGVEFVERSGRPNPDFEMLAFEAANIAPSIGSKLNKIKSVGYYLQKSKDNLGTLEMLSDTNFLKAMAVGTSVASNVPLDRLMQKYENILNSVDLEGEFKTYEQILMFLGWPDYQIGVDTKETKSRTRSRSRSRSRSRKR